MTELSDQTQEILLKVYIGQNIRSEGILQFETGDVDNIKILLAEGLIMENHWSGYAMFLTTAKGYAVAKVLMEKRIKEKEDHLITEFKSFPPKVLGFITKRFLSKKLYFRAETEKLGSWSMWEDWILMDGRVWILWNKFFFLLESAGLCIRTHYYVSTRGGELRDLDYVISPDVQAFLKLKCGMFDFDEDEEEILSLYTFLVNAVRVLGFDNIDSARQAYYGLLKEHSVKEGRLAGIINDMSKERITSEYRGLSSQLKPFEVINPISFQAYLDTNLVERGIDTLLEKEGAFKEPIIESAKKTDDRAKVEPSLMLPDDLILDKQLGDAYLLVRSFERDVREFVKDILGEGWLKRIENEKSLSGMVAEWKRKQKTDHDWGLEPDKDLMSYADMQDYAKIIRQYDGMFIKSSITLAEVETKLKDVANCGRNPIMHSRNLSRDMLATCMSAQNLLRNWMKEIRELRRKSN